ncbi:MAG TPA: hypothetical protein VLA43_21100 [Longimicrobiales bacterium]|nr:hypothetical protein [Longimicrobiales bacterium]
MAAGGPGCRPTGAAVAFPADLTEPSGVAVSLDHPGVLWTHNDAGSTLFAVDADGNVLARFRVRPRLTDWEDLALAPCSGGGSCLYLADLGDNYEERSSLAILRLREPDPATADTLGPRRTNSDTLAADVFPVRLPDGPRDIEAMLVLPGTRILAVTKGRNDGVTVYRYPGELRPDTVTLEEVQRLTPGPRILPRQVTGGSVSPDRGLVALRTYESVRFYTVDADTIVALDDGTVSLRTLQEAQGEGVGLGMGGSMFLVSEAGPMGGVGSLAGLRCRVGGR